MRIMTCAEHRVSKLDVERYFYMCFGWFDEIRVWGVV